MAESHARQHYTHVVHEAKADGGWSGQLRIVVGNNGQGVQDLVFVDSDLLGPRRLVLTVEQAAEVAAALVAAGSSLGEEETGPAQEDVVAFRDLLDLMANFSDNDQRARYLLASNWMRDRGMAASTRARTLSAVGSTLK